MRSAGLTIQNGEAARLSVFLHSHGTKMAFTPKACYKGVTEDMP